jgi:hypothetical protein
MSVESSVTSPLSIADGTFATQVELAFYTPFVQRVQVALAATAEYIINEESSSDANYADRAAFARLVALNPSYWAQSLSWLIVADSADMSASCTDQAILNRIYTIWPIASYKQTTAPIETTV